MAARSPAHPPPTITTSCRSTSTTGTSSGDERAVDSRSGLPQRGKNPEAQRRLELRQRVAGHVGAEGDLVRLRRVADTVGAEVLDHAVRREEALELRDR